MLHFIIKTTKILKEIKKKIKKKENRKKGGGREEKSFPGLSWHVCEQKKTKNRSV